MSNNHSPIKQKSLRKPAYTLRKQVHHKILIVTGTLVLGLVLYVGILLGIFGHVHIPYFLLVVTVLFCMFVLWVTKWEKRQRIELDRLELGLDGEVFVGEFLNAAGSENGWFVLHDFDTGYGNIDHIAITPQGVFTIETKTVSQYEGESTISYNGEDLRTEKRNINPPFQQVNRQAAFLAEHINTKLTMNVFVQPIVTYPGWKLRLLSGKKLEECSVWICLTTALLKVISSRPSTLSQEEHLRIYNFLASENQE